MNWNQLETIQKIQDYWKRQFKTYGTVRCKECDQDLTDKIQVYDYSPDKKTRVVRCENCNWRIKETK